MSKQVQHEDLEEIVLRYLEHPSPEIKQKLIYSYKSFIENIAKRFRSTEPTEDLIQVGYVGFLKALSKYNKNSSARFQTYATHLIMGEIKHYLRDRGLLIRHPAWVQETRHKIMKAGLTLEAKTGQQPTEQDISQHTGFNLQFIKDILYTYETLKPISLNGITGSEEDSFSEADSVGAIHLQEEPNHIEERVLLEGAIGELRSLEQDVLIYFHFHSMSQADIAQKLQISCNYVSYILRQALNKLRRHLINEEIEEIKNGIKNPEGWEEVRDTISRVYNAGYLYRRLEEEIHRASEARSNLGLLLVNFKGFERFSHYYGKESIHDFLEEAGYCFKQFARKMHVICRHSKTSFVFIMPLVGLETLKIRNQLEKAILVWMESRQAPTQFIRAEFGYSIFPMDGNTTKELLNSAYGRLREGKLKTTDDTPKAA